MTDPNRPFRISDGDGFYAALVDALDAAGPDEASALLSRLVLLLANEVGDAEVLMAALSAAKAPR